MKSYFRLLFLSFGLLFLLGISGKQSEVASITPVESNTCASLDFSDLIKPDASTTAIEVLKTSEKRLLPEYKLESASQKENNVASGIYTLLHSSRERFMEFCPGIQGKAGYLLHHTSHRGDPSLS